MLKRNAPGVRKYLKEVKGGLQCTKDVRIQIPFSFRKKDLVILQNKKSILGSFVMIVGDEYLVWSATTMYEIEPDTISKVVVDDVEYYEFFFKANSTIITSLTTIRNSSIIYEIFNIYLFQGKAPWYFSVGDMVSILSTAGDYAGLEIDGTPEILEILEALSARLSSDLMVMIKDSKVDPKKYHEKVKFIPLNNVTYMQTIMGKLVGNYQSKGMLSALTTQPSKPGSVESLIRAN